MNILAWIVLGLIAGAIAKAIYSHPFLSLKGVQEFHPCLGGSPHTPLFITYL